MGIFLVQRDQRCRYSKVDSKHEITDYTLFRPKLRMKLLCITDN